MGLDLAPLYAIVDRATLDARSLTLSTFAEELRDAGVRLLQYRDKKNGPQEILRAAGMIANIFEGTNSTLILNDRADLAALLGWGVHVGQGDLPVEAARRLVGKAIIGISTHSEEQVLLAEKTDASYIAIGPVFPTYTKVNAEPVVGLEGVRRARELTSKPLVAIGGITAVNAADVWHSGADAVALVGALLPSVETSTPDAVRKFARRR